MHAEIRELNSMRPTEITRSYTMHAEGSVLVCFGNTKVLCNATVSDTLPRFLQNGNKGWVTAEYSMLPRSTHKRMTREASRGKQGGRTLEIQRLISRSLRAAVDLTELKGFNITVDCDVIQADGGTRTAAITGGCIALHDAINTMIDKKIIKTKPFKQWVAAASVGIVAGQATLDLNYDEDSGADTDMNVVMNESGDFIEIQGTAEKKSFSQTELMQMLELAKQGIINLIKLQQGSVTS